MLRFEDYKLKTEQAFALLHSTSPYDIYARVEIMSTLKILKYQLGEFQCHIRNTSEQNLLRAEVLEFYPSYVISPSEDMIRHSLCSCENVALKPDPEAIERRLKQQVIKLVNAKPLDLEPIAKLITEEIASKNTTPAENGGYQEDESVEEVIAENDDAVSEEDDSVVIDESLTTNPSEMENNNDVDLKKTYLKEGYIEEPMENPESKDAHNVREGFDSRKSTVYNIEIESQRDIIKRTKLVAHYYKYERGAGRTRIRYDMYRLNNVIVRYDNKGSELHIVRRIKESSDNILYEISDPNRVIGPDLFSPWLGYPSEQECHDHAAIITRIRYDIISKRNRDLFNHRLKFLGMKLV